MGFGAWIKRKLLNWAVGDITQDKPRLMPAVTPEQRIAALEREVTELRLNDRQMRTTLLTKVGAINDAEKTYADQQLEAAAGAEIQAAMLDVAAGAPMDAELLKKYPRAAQYLMRQIKPG